MALQNRIGKDISTHTFTSNFILWVQGIKQGADLISKFNLDSTEVSQAQQLKSVYDALSDDGQRAFYLWKLEAGANALEKEDITPQEYASLMGI